MSSRYTVFEGHQFLVNGPEKTVIPVISARQKFADSGTILVFADSTGEQTELGLTVAELTEPAAQAAGSTAARGKGRPKLGVVAREVTLLPRHWEWLRAQPGGASAALRRLVDAGRRADSQLGAIKGAQNSAYAFMSAIAGNLAGFEEACRALFARNEEAFLAQTSDWPADVRRYAAALAAKAFVDEPGCLERS